MCIGLEMDIRDLKFPDQSFDVVIDKGIGVIRIDSTDRVLRDIMYQVPWMLLCAIEEMYGTHHQN